MDTLGQRIRHARKVKGTSQQAVADHFGIKRVSVTQWEGDTTRPDQDKLGSLAALLGTSIAWLVSGEGPGPNAQGSKSTARPADTFRPEIVPGADLVGAKNFPVYAAARGGDGHTIVTFEAIDWVKRPSILENVKNAYGVYIVGDSMIPAYWQGDMVLVNPHLPPAREKDAVLYHVPPVEGDAEAMVKHLLSFDDRDWRLRQWNPPEGENRDFTVSRADWTVAHMIVGKYHAR